MATSKNDPLLRSDEELQEAPLVPVTPHNAPVTLAEYDPGWPELFTREASRIRAVLGEDAAVLVEHAGSTSVPGLAAKPIIDIVLAVPDSADEPVYVPAMTGAGYMLRAREPVWFEHRMFKGPDTDINLHVFSAGASEIDRLLFRAWLRASDADRDAYLKVKRELAQRTWRHIQHYADAKTAIIQWNAPLQEPPDNRQAGPGATAAPGRRGHCCVADRWAGQAHDRVFGRHKVAPLGQEHVNDLAVLVNRPVQVRSNGRRP